MNRIAVAMHVLNLSLAVAVPARAAEPNPQAAKAVAEIEKLGAGSLSMKTARTSR